MTAQIPNAITLLNLLCGAAVLVFASSGQWVWACGFIFLAAVFDFLDGLVARLLGVHSSIGVQLDSLADMVSFGLAPAFLIFCHVLVLHTSFEVEEGLNGLSFFIWIELALPFLIAVFAAIRLARFNIDSRQKEAFTGLPTPALALLFAATLMLYHLGQPFYNSELFSRPLFWELAAAGF